jgi:DNA polymerase III epsilon subunit-like protein
MTSTNNINAGKPWTQQEDELLVKLYNEDKLDIISIAQIYQRAPGGIISRLVKNKIIPDKKTARGYDQYILLEQAKPELPSIKEKTKNDKVEKLLKSKPKSKPIDSNKPDELILIGDTEYILNDGKVYEIKKIKGSLYGQFDDKTSTVKALKPSIKKSLEYFTEKKELSGSILWAGTDLPLIQGYLPNLQFVHIDTLENSPSTIFSVCVCNGYFGQLSNLDSPIDMIQEEISFITGLLEPNADLLVFDSKNYHQDLIPVLIQNNFKIIEEEADFSSKLCWMMSIKKPSIEKQGIMVLDTETTGFPNGRDPKDWEKFNGARLIELGYIIYDETGKKIKEYDSLVKPDNWTITNSFVHGITQADAISSGKPIGEVLAELSNDLDIVSAFVCHNINFDMDIISAESYRAKQTELANKIESKRKICTMELGKKFMKINKRPKLVELYKFLFKQEFKQDHRALSDCVACADCFYSMTC